MVTQGKANHASGVYAIYSSCNGRTYIGSAKNFSTRWSRHTSELNNDYPDNPHYNDHLQNAWNKYGPDAFAFFIVEECPIDQLLIREQYYLDLNFDPNLHPEPYNICRIAGSRFGATHTEEAKAKIGAASKGRKHTPEALEKMSIANTGRKHTPETKEKISASKTGRKHTEESKKKMSDAQMGNTNRLGCKDSDETKAKKSEAMMGNQYATGTVPSLETREKLSEAMMGNTNGAGRTVSAETRERLSESHMGHEVSEETRARISAANKAYWARKREAEAAD